jgi:HEPN domain-containing protein
MSARPDELARSWLEKARHDLFTARHTLAAPDGPTDTPCFHAQQAVEKALKALLTVRDRPCPKTHDLLVLFDGVLAFAPELDVYREALGLMTAYAVEVRYLGDGFDPERQEAAEVLGTAEELVARVEVLVRNAAQNQ